MGDSTPKKTIKDFSDHQATPAVLSAGTHQQGGVSSVQTGTCSERSSPGGERIGEQACGCEGRVTATGLPRWQVQATTAAAAVVALGANCEAPGWASHPVRARDCGPWLAGHRACLRLASQPIPSAPAIASLSCSFRAAPSSHTARPLSPSQHPCAGRAGGTTPHVELSGPATRARAHHGGLYDGPVQPGQERRVDAQQD